MHWINGSALTIHQILRPTGRITIQPRFTDGGINKPLYKVSGFLSTDKLTLAPGFTVVNQTFAEINNEGVIVKVYSGYTGVNGVLGLGYPSLSPLKGLNVTPVFQNLIQQGIISEPIFAFWFNGQK